MNFDCCGICGNGFDLYNRVSYDDTHFYHLECFNDPESKRFIGECQMCLWVYFSKSTNQKNCILCEVLISDSNETCIKQIGLCNDCARSKLINDLNQYCSICNNTHYCKYTTCLECNKYIAENFNFYSEVYFYHCKECIIKKNCGFCDSQLEFGDLRCKSDHFYHLSCLKKKPPNTKQCENCLEDFSRLLCKFLENKQEGSLCSLCGTYRYEDTSCMIKNYFCESCSNTAEFTNTSLDCFCDYCEGIKKFIESQKEKIIECSSCNTKNFKEFESTCKKVKICVNCAKITQKPNKVFEELCRCNCNKCKLDQSNSLKGCSICLLTDFNTRTTKCERDNFYCEECVNHKFCLILNHCSCEFCISIVSNCLKIKGIQPKCKTCKVGLKPDEKCDILKFYCEKCWKEAKTEIKCTCYSHKQDLEAYDTFFYLKSRLKPNCSNCKRNSNFAVDCNHNQCFLCVFKKIIPKFLMFLENYKQKDVRKIEKKFSFECIHAGCKFNFDTSGALCIEKMMVFSDSEREILASFLPYFDGIEFEFKVCRCLRVVGVSEDIVLGCGCD